MNSGDCPGAALPRCPETPRELWANWISRGWFEGDLEGRPFWSNFGHVQSWWEERNRHNLHFVHFNDLLFDLPGEIKRMAEFAGLPCDPALRESIAEATKFKSMKANASILACAIDDIFDGGADRFINKGANGRWRDVLTEEDLAAYDATALATLSPECRVWLEGAGKSRHP